MFARILSVILLIAGLGIFTFGTHVSRQASRGEQKISQAEENAQGGRRPIVGPVRKSVRAQAAQNAQEKIGDEKGKVAASQVTANWLHGSGIVLFVVGIGCLAFSFSNKRRT